MLWTFFFFPKSEFIILFKKRLSQKNDFQHYSVSLDYSTCFGHSSLPYFLILIYLAFKVSLWSIFFFPPTSFFVCDIHWRSVRCVLTAGYLDMPANTYKMYKSIIFPFKTEKKNTNMHQIQRNSNLISAHLEIQSCIKRTQMLV